MNPFLVLEAKKPFDWELNPVNSLTNDFSI